ncbi:MAG TPA: histidine phosphatase family protein [Bryobacteraceae bacterium]
MLPEGAQAAQPSPMPANATIYLIRHAEKPDTGPGLSPAGQARAQAYVHYLQNQTDPQGKPIQWDYLFASTDSENSDRPLLTITPLATAIKKPIDSNCADKHYLKLEQHIRENAKDYANKNILICWHHGEILDLAGALGASPESLPSSSNWPNKWPGEVFGWLLKVYYEGDGTLENQQSQAINEHLMPDDTIDPVYNG